MSIKILQRPALNVVGLQIDTRPMSAEIPALWPKFVARIPEIESQTEPKVTYGVMRSEGGPADVLHYLAAVAVSKSERIPPGMHSLSIPAGTYAVFRYPLSGLGQGFGEIFGRLLPASDFVQVPGALYERYDEAFCPDEPSSAVEIGVPVRRR